MNHLGRSVLIGAQLVLRARHSSKEVLTTQVMAFGIIGFLLHILKHQLTRQVAICCCLGSVPVEVHKELPWQEGQGASTLNVIAGHIAKDVALSELPFSWGGLLESEFS